MDRAWPDSWRESGVFTLQSGEGIPVILDYNFARDRVAWLKPGASDLFPNGALLHGYEVEVNVLIETLRLAFTVEDSEFLKSIGIASH